MHHQMQQNKTTITHMCMINKLIFFELNKQMRDEKID